MRRNYVMFFLMVLTIPLFLGISAWQANECGMIRKEIKILEKNQEDCVTEHKAVVNEIVDLLATDRLENEAQKMGLQKMRPEDVILIIMGGKGHGM